ncbi:MAG: hypothetical protein EOP60_07190, partial [Sphingomonadales bacterium]
MALKFKLPGSAAAAALRSCAIAGLLFAAACDSGSSPSPTPTPTPTPAAPNRAPTITSINGLLLNEGQSGTAYRTTATDPDGDPVTFTITGGRDPTRFTLAASGELAFVTTPDFENPLDINKKNQYNIEITANDGRGGTAMLSLWIEITNVVDPVLETLTTSLIRPVDVSSLKIADETGGHFGFGGYFVGQGGTPDNYRDSAATFPNRITSIATGDLWPETRLDDVAVATISPTGQIDIYALYCENVRVCNRNIITNAPVISIAGGRPDVDAWVGIGPDGFIYIGTSDGSAPGVPNGNAQNKRSLLGKILRVKPNLRRPTDTIPTPPPYSIPAGNPYADGVDGAPEVFAYGFHRPSTGRFTGSNLLIGDSGDGRMEEINLIRPADAGGNYGWPFREGTQTVTGSAPAGVIDPVLQYRFGTGPTQGQSIVAGIVYTGPFTPLDGQYIFGDTVTGSIWSVPYASLQQGTTLDATSFTLRN